MDEVALSQFLTLQSPIVVQNGEGERLVMLAFGIGLSTGHLLAMCVGFGGGPLVWVPANLLDWPAPIQGVANGPPQTVRAELKQ